MNILRLAILAPALLVTACGTSSHGTPPSDGGVGPDADASVGSDASTGGDSNSPGDASTAGDTGAASETSVDAGGDAGEGGDGGADTGAGVEAGPAFDGGCNTVGAGSKLLYPDPIISRQKQTFSSPPGGALVVDGQYHNGGWSAGTPSVAAPSWVAIKLVSGPTRLLVSWDDGGTYNYQDPAGTTVYGFPADYEIDTSANSTNGSDGVWTPQAMVTGNQVRTRAHSIDFSGQTWVKMMITAAPATANDGVQIGEIDVHDISITQSCMPEDTWFFMGDSITAFAYDRALAHQPSFAASIHTASPTFFPAMINGGIGGEKSSDGLARLQEVLDLNPDYRFVVLSYGTNDAGDGVATTDFQTNMQAMITMLQSAARTPVIPHIPYSGDGGHNSIPAYNAVIDTLVQADNLLAGPDFYAFFQANSPADFTCPPCGGGRTTDLLHPNDTGLEAMNSLWSQTMAPLYP